jgi:hypothetical protein
LLQGGDDQDIKNLSDGIFWRALPLALFAFGNNNEDADTQEELPPNCIDICLHFLHDFPVAPGYAGSPVLLLKPLAQTTLLLKGKGELLAL